MTQERGGYQTSQAVDIDRLQALQQFQKTIDPFQEGSNGERIRAQGLSRLYLQMADPSMDFLLNSTNLLVTLPFANLQQLRLDSYDARERPEQDLAQHGIANSDLNRLVDGIGHTGELLDDILRKYDYKTGELRWSEELDPKGLAEGIHEHIQVSKSEKQIREMAIEVHSEPDLTKRYHMGLDLKDQILGYIGSFPFAFYRRDEREIIVPTWQNLTRHSDLSTQLYKLDGSIITGNFRLARAVDVAEAAITRYPFERMLEKLPSRDQGRFDELRLQYGAKAANLLILFEFVGDINMLYSDRLYGPRIVVPDFKVVPVGLYRAWSEGKFVDDDLHPYFEWVSGLKEEDSLYEDNPPSANYIVRSSAVFSEDGEKVTGAGMYDSVRVHGGATFEDFKEAVTSVYTSTDSPHAQAYRKQYGIDSEEMGLVIQKFISPDKNSVASGEGFCNSRLPGVPQLMEVVTRTSRNFVNREELDLFLALDVDKKEEAFQSVHHFPPDIHRVAVELPIRVAQITSAVERIWGRDIQVEFVAEGPEIHFVQVRELPTRIMPPESKIQFPETLPTHTGAAIGIGDMELPILEREDNSQKKGVVVIRANYGWTNWVDNNSCLPKEGAVIITDDEGGSGHIQTLCAEKGLVCIFPAKEEKGGPTLKYSEFSGLNKVRVVANGLEGRVYEIQQEQKFK